MKKRWTIATFAVILLVSVFLLTGYPILFRVSTNATATIDYSSKQINPLRGADLNNGEWSVYLVIAHADFTEITPELKPYKIWKATSSDVLNQIQSSWNLRVTGGDIATAESTVIIVHNGEIVFESGIVIDKDLFGLQSENFGWAEPADRDSFAKSLSGFKQVLTPFVFI